MSKRIAILQSNYVPWRGYFDLIQRVDEFVFYDEAQYTTSDWRNRNLIKTPQGLRWLTVPVGSKGNLQRSIADVHTVDNRWRARHLHTLQHLYRRAPAFHEVMDWLQPLYASQETSLSLINQRLISAIALKLGIQTPLTISTQYPSGIGKTQKLVDICKATGATHYLSGPAAQAYLDEPLFRAKGIEVVWMDYPAYRPYPQLYPPYAGGVSILDLLFMTGSNAHQWL